MDLSWVVYEREKKRLERQKDKRKKKKNKKKREKKMAIYKKVTEGWVGWMAARNEDSHLAKKDFQREIRREATP